MNPKTYKETFDHEGYLIIDDILSEVELDSCRSEIERLHHIYKKLEMTNDPDFKKFQREPYAEGVKLKDGLPVLRKIEDTRNISDVFRNLSEHPKLLGILKTLLGPDLLLFRSTLMLKPAFHGSVHAPHQDSAYWPIDPPSLVTVSIALNEATVDNGCFNIIPRSHKEGLKQWGLIAQAQDHEITNRQADQIDVPLKAGSALFFHSLLVHGSGPNKSCSPRNTALYAYFPPQVRFLSGNGNSKTMTYPVVSGLDGLETFTLKGIG